MIKTADSQYKDPLFSPESLAQLDPSKVPHHIAIIQDGNRRWADTHQKSLEFGHRRGMQATVQAVRAAAELGIRAVTLYSFSTENRQRPKSEVAFLMTLLEAGLLEFQEEMVLQGVRLNVIGDIANLPQSLQKQLEQTVETTREGTGIDVILAINYGSRDEIRRAALQMSRDMQEGLVNETDIDEARFASYLDTARWGDPELLIRTSGETRVSNFLLWQISYSELYFADALWPEFEAKHLLDAVIDYQNRKKRLGL